ncbi:hypothetical protein ACAG24_009150 [Mycobacterium sp. pW049]
MTLRGPAVRVLGGTVVGLLATGVAVGLLLTYLFGSVIVASLVNLIAAGL